MDNKNDMTLLVGSPVGSGAPGAVHQLVEPDHLRHMACQGYSLVAVLYTDEIKLACDSESKPVTDPGYTYSNRTEVTSKTMSHVVRHPMFLMRLDPESALQAKENERLELLKERNEFERTASEAEKRAAEADKAKEKVATELRHKQEDYKSLDEEKGRLRTSARKLEDDIAKIRKAIGERQMKEILGT